MIAIHIFNFEFLFVLPPPLLNAPSDMRHGSAVLYANFYYFWNLKCAYKNCTLSFHNLYKSKICRIISVLKRNGVLFLPVFNFYC